MITVNSYNANSDVFNVSISAFDFDMSVNIYADDSDKSVTVLDESVSDEARELIQANAAQIVQACVKFHLNVEIDA